MTVRNTLLRRITTGALLLLPTVMFAQSPRMVLVEEATNASCPPCAAQNPFFEYFLELPHSRATLIPITWHSNFPGRDVMNQAAPAMHDGRVQYYAVSGVPTVMVNGRIPNASSGNFYSGAPADTLGITLAADNARGTMSPITLGISETRNGNEVTVSVNVSSTEALAGKTLRIVAVEGHHYYANAGSNGEKDFNMVSRAMLPGLAGTPLEMAAGESKTVTETYTIDAGWNADEMYIVAFVQDEQTKEVMQAGTNQTSAAVNSAQESTVISKTAGSEPTVWTGTLDTDTPGEYTVSITEALPTGWDASVMVDGQPVLDGGKIQIDGTVPMSITIDQMQGRAGKGMVELVLEGGRAGRASKNFTVYGGDIDVLVLSRDEGDVRIPAAYETALEKGDFTYALVESADEARFNYNDYKALLMQSGKWILTEQDVELLTNFIDNGGNLFLAGAEIAWALADPTATNVYQNVAFLNEYLHADYVADAASNFTVNGVADDEITRGMVLQIRTGVPNQDTPDKILPRDGARTILTYGPLATEVAGIRHEADGKRLIYLGFGIEGIADLTKRTQLLSRGLDWLIDGVSSVDDEQAPISSTMLQAARPNPASGAFELPVDLKKGTHVTIALYNSRGEKVAVVADRQFTAGRTAVGFDSSLLPAGIYTAVMNAAGTTATQQISIVR